MMGTPLSVPMSLSAPMPLEERQPALSRPQFDDVSPLARQRPSMYLCASMMASPFDAGDAPAALTKLCSRSTLRRACTCPYG